MGKDTTENEYRFENPLEGAPFQKAYRAMIWDHSLNDGDFRAYLIIAQRCVRSGSTFASVATLARDLNCTKRSMYQKLNRLKDRGLIRDEPRDGTSTIRILVSLEKVYPKSELFRSLKAIPKKEAGEKDFRGEKDFTGGVKKKVASGVKEISPKVEEGGKEEEKKKKGEAAAAFVKLWNASGLRKCIAFSSSRANALHTRLKDSFWKQNYQAALKRASGIPGMSGANGRNWRADIDWFLRPDNVAKLMEGKYDGWNDGRDGKPVKPQSKPQTSKWDDPKWHARQAKIHDLYAQKKQEAKEKDKPEPKPPQGYDPKWKPRVVEDSVDEDEDKKLPF